MERKGERERVREREWENDRMRFFIPYGSATPASSVPPGYHGPLDGHHYAGPSGSGASLLSRSAPLPPTPQQGSSKSRGSPQTVHPTPFPPAYSPRPTHPPVVEQNRIGDGSSRGHNTIDPHSYHDARHVGR